MKQVDSSDITVSPLTMVIFAQFFKTSNAFKNRTRHCSAVSNCPLALADSQQSNLACNSAAKSGTACAASLFKYSINSLYELFKSNASCSFSTGQLSKDSGNGTSPLNAATALLANNSPISGYPLVRAL